MTSHASAFRFHMRLALAGLLVSAEITAAPVPAPPGSWRSPVTLDAVFGELVGLNGLRLHGKSIYWLEGRPSDGGRSVLARWQDGASHDVTTAPTSLRTRVHEYGGGAYVVAGETLYFSNEQDQAIWQQPLGEPATPVRMTASEGMRYADAIVDVRRQRLIAVREDHSVAGREAINTLVAIDLQAPHAETVLQSGWDFYSSPRLSPDGRKLAWLSWNHPNMPWDGTTLWTAAIEADGGVHTAVRVAGGDSESVFQPEWSPRGDLVFTSDRSGWWNLYRQRGTEVKALHAMAAEFGSPQWAFGMSMYGFDGAGRIVCTYILNGDSHLAVLDPETGAFRELATPYREITDLRVGDGFAAFLGGSPSEPDSVVRLDLASGNTQVLRRSSTLSVDAGYLSPPQPIEFPTTGGRTAHAFFYPARNRDFTLPQGENPPLLLLDHGGPTGMTTATFGPAIQYWTSRGIGVVDVNYGGSSGYGRDYRRRLNGQWGIVDVDDSVNAAKYLVDRGLADAARLAIRGGSAGGYTTLCALTFRNTFKAGASYYGIGDLETLARDTHKFESRYLDSMVGPYPAQKALYQARSPVNFIDRLATPLILFQGLKDPVVPPNQAQAMFDAVKAKGLPVAYISYPDERHGFRTAAANRRSLEAELYFYGKVFGFTPADEIEPVPIENLPGAS